MVKRGFGVAVMIALAACGKRKASPPPEPASTVDAWVVVDATPADAVPRKPVQPWGRAGSCKLTVVGNSALDQAEGLANVTTSFWYTAEDRPKDDPKDSFLINCSGATLQVTIARRGDAVLGPKQYVNDKSTTDLSIQAVVNTVAVEQPMGSVTVTAFDTHHIAATLVITGKLGTRPVEITGRLDFDCPGYAGCE